MDKINTQMSVSAMSSPSTEQPNSINSQVCTIHTYIYMNEEVQCVIIIFFNLEIPCIFNNVDFIKQLCWFRYYYTAN